MLDEKMVKISEDQNIIFQRRESGSDQDILNKTWLEAARNSDLEKLQETFDRGAHPFAKDEDENTVLHLACLSKAPLQTMEKLALRLSKKKSLYDVAEKTPFQKLFSELNCNGDSVLHLASTHADLIELLFLEGIEIDARNNNGETPLHLASKSKQKESILTLIQAGADIYANNFNQETPLDYAQDVSLKKAMVQESDAYLPIGFNHELNFDEKKAAVPSLRELTARAEQGDSEAQYQLGVIYYRDHMKLGVLSDDKKAVKYWKQSAELNHPVSCYEYAVCLTRGTGGIPKDTKRASFYANKAVEGGWLDALKEKAGNGDPKAQYHLGRCCGYGLLVPKDEKEAVRWYKLSAEQRYAPALCNLGGRYGQGCGVAKNEKEAVRLYRLAAEQGYAPALCNLGTIYANGRVVAKDEKEAVRLYRLAADQGNASALCNLGVMVNYGRGIAKDEKEAVRLYRLAVDQGNADAQTNLGCAYADGLGVAKDEKKAARWFRLAADQGNAFAKNRLKELLPASKDSGIFAKMFGSFFQAKNKVDENRRGKVCQFEQKNLT